MNEVPDETQPTNAVLGEFGTATSADDVVSGLTSGGIDPDRIWIYSGDDGLEAYEARATMLTKVFDDTAGPIRYGLEDGHTIAIVQCVGAEDAESIVEQLVSIGAENTQTFGDWTVVP